MGPKRPCLRSIAETASFLFLLKNGLVYTLFGLIARAMMYVICACRFIFRSGSLDIVGGDTSLTSFDDTSHRYSSGLIRHFCLHPNIRHEHCNTTVSPKWKYFQIRSISCMWFRMFCGLSVNPTYVSPCELSCIYNWLCADARHFPSSRAIVCDCHWEHPPGGCGQFNKSWLAATLDMAGFNHPQPSHRHHQPCRRTPLLFPFLSLLRFRPSLCRCHSHPPPSPWSPSEADIDGVLSGCFINVSGLK